MKLKDKVFHLIMSYRLIFNLSIFTPFIWLIFFRKSLLSFPSKWHKMTVWNGFFWVIFSWILKYKRFRHWFHSPNGQTYYRDLQLSICSFLIKSSIKSFNFKGTPYFCSKWVKIVAIFLFPLRFLKFTLYFCLVHN